MLFPPFQRFVADVVSVMLFFKMYAGDSRVGALARGRKVVREADDGQDASPLVTSCPASLSFVPAW